MSSGASSGYRRPSEALEALVDVEREPSLQVSADGRWGLRLSHKVLALSVEDLSSECVQAAGHRWDPEWRLPEKTVFGEDVRLLRFFAADAGPAEWSEPAEEQLTAKQDTGLTRGAAPDGSPVKSVRIAGLENYNGFKWVSWLPDSKGVVMCARDPVRLRLDLVYVPVPVDGDRENDPHQAVVSAQVILKDRILNAVVNRPYDVLGDGSHLLCYLVPNGIGPPPVKPKVPTGPSVQENATSKQAPARTYTRLIASEYDEKAFEYFTRSEPVLLCLSRKSTKGVLIVEPRSLSANGYAGALGAVSSGEMIRHASLSPDARHLLVTVTQRPFSWQLPYSGFAKSVQVWHLSSPLQAYPPPTRHDKALTKHPSYPARGSVRVVSFDQPDPGYEPTEFTHPVVISNDSSVKPGGWADPSHVPVSQLRDRFSYHGPVWMLPGEERPKNPVGRTGMTGRGLLGKWGPNHAADAIVTRQLLGRLQVVAIQRKDTGEWALPGGMVDPGETVSAAMKREFLEEAGNVKQSEIAVHEANVNRLFSHGVPVYSGYVDDPRNTDNAWMESSFTHFHCGGPLESLGSHIPLVAGDDASAVRWLDIDENVSEFAHMYASHKTMVLRAVAQAGLLENTAGMVPSVSAVHVIQRSTVIEIPSEEGVPISFDARMRGPRGFAWHWQEPATLTFKFALDGGDPKAEPRSGNTRDSLWLLKKPYILQSPESANSFESFHPSSCAYAAELLAVEYRLTSLVWGQRNFPLTHAIVKESWRKTRRQRTWLLEVPDSSKMFASPPTLVSAKLLFDKSSDDAYSDPGAFETCHAKDFLRNLKRNEDGAYYLIGSGASPAGTRPFVDLFYVSSGGAVEPEPGRLAYHTVRLWRCALGLKQDESLVTPSNEVGRTLPVARYDVYENPLFVPSRDWLLFSRESNDTPPTIMYRHHPSGREFLLTETPHPQPALLGVQKELVKYSREDGVELSGELYLPRNYDPLRHGPRPCLLWAYPREFKGKADAGQVKDSQYKFIRSGWSEPTLWVEKQWVVLRFSCPIVGEGEGVEPNDTFVEQLRLNARATVAYLIGRSIGIWPGGFAVGGHSYGAFQVAHLLAHTDLFAAGIGRSGAYIRALTPFGFQAEERTYWQAPETYAKLSPFHHVPAISKGPGKLLLIHGMEDENSGTYPLQSERLFNALKGHGAVVKLVMLPKEGHGYSARESILHTLAEQEDWLDRHVTFNFEKRINKAKPLPPLLQDSSSKVARPNEIHRTRLVLLLACFTGAAIILNSKL